MTRKLDLKGLLILFFLDQIIFLAAELTSTSIEFGLLSQTRINDAMNGPGHSSSTAAFSCHIIPL